MIGPDGGGGHVRDRDGFRASWWALIAVAPLAQSQHMAMGPVLPIMQNDLGLSYSEVGYIVSAFALARFSMNIPAGALMRRFNPRALLLAMLLVNGLACLAGIAVDAGWQIALARLFIGGGSAVVYAVVLAWLLTSAPAHLRGRLMSLSEASFAIVALSMPLFTGVLAASLGWRASFVLGALAVAGSLAAVVVWTRPDEARRVQAETHPTAPRSGPPWAGLRAGGVLLAVTAMLAFVIFFSRSAFQITLVPLVGGDRLALSPLVVAVAQSLASAVGVGTVVFGGSLSDRFGLRALVLPGAVLLTITLVAQFAVVDAPTYVLLAAFLGVSAVQNSFPLQLIGHAGHGGQRVQATTVYRLAADSGTLSAPLVVGVALDSVGYGGAHLAGLLPAVVLVLVLAVLGPRWARALKAPSS